MGTHTSLDELRGAASILDGIRLADDLTVAASRDGGARAVRLLADAAVDDSDQLTAIAAIHALGRVFDETADEHLVRLLDHDAAFVREHTVWALGSRLPRLDAVTTLVSLVTRGGFEGMLAQRTLELWGASMPAPLALAIDTALLGVRDPGERARLIETIGVLPGRIADRALLRVAIDADEPDAARAAAISALGDRPATDRTLREIADLARGDDELSSVARLALLDLTAEPAEPRDTDTDTDGLTVAQLFVHADIDGDLTRVGAGDNGGIATLLVRLGDALVAPGRASSHVDDTASRVTRVVTLSRTTHDGALDQLATLRRGARGHVLAGVPFFGPSVSMSDAWSRRIETERGIRRVLRAAGRVDAIHLRMADVGTLAASSVARDLGIPVVFTVAPDPHAAIRSRDTAGELTRGNLGDVDRDEHYWFRVRLVQRLAADAAHTVLFPRPDLEREMLDLVGIDVTAHPERHTVVAEGIDLSVIEQSRVDALSAMVDPGGLEPASCAAFAELDSVLESLPESRRALPLAVSVGRVHRVKGTAALVEAWASDPRVRRSVNLLIVGGDLEQPSSDEREQLDRIHAIIPPGDAAEAGLLLAGHRSNDTVGRWLAATRYGRPGRAASSGIYVCASVKEEFGIAILEAMATGLTVVAPDGGGPATYVEAGVTGLLVETTSREALANGIVDALAIAQGPAGFDNAERASAMVAGTFAIGAMASSLAATYRDVASAAADLREWELSRS
ncbi:glycosyltransferase [Marisediminicola sp. LYQ85]|uniref:glycosyltransferase n=1 Tax=Marisediminicola sp. LYQ85 TaxID=3391062 RepID=UPI0039834DEA